MMPVWEICRLPGVFQLGVVVQHFEPADGKLMTDKHQSKDYYSSWGMDSSLLESLKQLKMKETGFDYNINIFFKR